MNTDKKFLDSLDGSWGDAISNTYEDKMGNLLEFTLSKHRRAKTNINGKKILKFIIKYSDKIKVNVISHNLSSVMLYYVKYSFVPLNCILFILEDGIEYSPRPLPNDKKQLVSVGVEISHNTYNHYGPMEEVEIDYILNLCNSFIYDLQDNEMYNRTDIGYIPAHFNNISNEYNEPPKFSIDIKNQLKEKGLNI